MDNQTPDLTALMPAPPLPSQPAEEEGNEETHFLAGHEDRSEAPYFEPSLAPSTRPSLSGMPSISSSHALSLALSRFPSVVSTVSSSGIYSERAPSYDIVRVSTSERAPRRTALRWADLEASAPVYSADAEPAPPPRAFFDINRANSVPPRCHAPAYKRRRRDAWRELGKKMLRGIKNIGGKKLGRQGT